MDQERLWKKWVLWGLINFAILALIGLLMRYKIAFSFPYFYQKNLQHAHSHFAFYGWMSHMLFVLIGRMYSDSFPDNIRKWYHRLIAVGLVFSFGMLLSFTYQGYKIISITFSTLAILNATVLAMLLFRTLKEKVSTDYSVRWIFTGLICNLLSSLGTFYLAYMIASRHFQQDHYLASVYFFLHFQYNGWFFLACMGLLLKWAGNKGISIQNAGIIFICLGGMVFPGWLLSVLWLDLPFLIRIWAVVAGIAQIPGLFFLVRSLYPSRAELFPDTSIRYGMGLVSLALGIKYLLQFLSLFPAIAQWAFGIRSVVIAYLHLNFLNILTLSIFAFLYLSGWLPFTPRGRRLFWSLVLVFSLNEIFLGLQGTLSVVFISIPHIQELLTGIAALMAAGASAAVWVYRQEGIK